MSTVSTPFSHTTVHCGTGQARRSGAIYSDCGLYRYRLWREWGAARRTLLWIMLNPSTADHLGNNDPTIERCERRAAAWGFDRLEIVNLFALRSPDPRVLRRAAAPVGPENDRAILEAAPNADEILCAWGALGRLHDRASQVRTLLAAPGLAGLGLAGLKLTCLGLTRSGEPAHPLYLPYSREPVSYEPEWK
jgi:hypothetical protein